MPKIQNKHGVVVTVQEKGWMDSEIIKIWIEKVWRARIGGLSRRRSLLVFDSFRSTQDRAGEAIAEIREHGFVSNTWRAYHCSAAFRRLFK